LPDDLISSGTVFAISSTFSADPAPVAVVGSLVSVPLAQPESASALAAANTAAMRQNFFGPP